MDSSLTEVQLQQLAELLFPDVKESIDVYEEKYPVRDTTAPVTRFSPSPTGSMHIGGVFTALVSERFAHLQNGVFYLRVEDTDQNRLVESAFEGILSAFKNFNIPYDEGLIDLAGTEKGEYAPYTQSHRLAIYRAYAKELVRSGRAYPCFTTVEELDELRKRQEAIKIRPGYYGKWAVHRNLPFATITENLNAKKPWVLRFRSNGSDKNQQKYNDLTRGDITVTENDQDIVLLKSDSFPTYHLAHIVDDHLMRTTHVIRGDEWLSSLAIHLELFAAFGWTPPRYGHLAPILKLEGGGKRKLSKRKDPEAAVGYYSENGYPSPAVIEYLLNIANSDFEPWRVVNPTLSYNDFPVRIEKMSKSGALFDLKKLDDISKNIVGGMSGEAVYEVVAAWSQKFAPDFYTVLTRDPAYSTAVLNIERGGATTRKDIGKWSDTREAIGYFFDDIYAELKKNLDITAALPATVTPAVVQALLNEYLAVYDASLDKVAWFDALKDFAVAHGYARDGKEFKLDPTKYKGTVGDVAMLIRLALTTKTKTPDLHESLRVMGIDRVRSRLASFSSGFSA